MNFLECSEWIHPKYFNQLENEVKINFSQFHVECSFLFFFILFDYLFFIFIFLVYLFEINLISEKKKIIYKNICKVINSELLLKFSLIH